MIARRVYISPLSKCFKTLNKTNEAIKFPAEKANKIGIGRDLGNPTNPNTAVYINARR